MIVTGILHQFIPLILLVSIISYNEIPVGVYKISISKQGFYLEYVMSEFVFDYKIIKGRTALLEELSRVHYALELGAADRRDNRTAASGDKDEFG